LPTIRSFDTIAGLEILSHESNLVQYNGNANHAVWLGCESSGVTREVDPIHTIALKHPRDAFVSQEMIPKP